MEVFLVLVVAGVLLLGPIAFGLVLLLRREVRVARERERALIARVYALEQGTRAAAPAAVPTPPSPPAETPAPPSVLRAPSFPRPPDVETLVGGQWLTWLGVLAIFFGTAFFLAYDLGESPLAGTGQILIGLLVGASFIISGRFLARRAQRFLGRGLLGGGVALLYLAAYASYGFHRLVPPVVVFPFLLGASAIGAGLALAESSIMVVSLTQAGAFLTPLLLRGEGDPTVVLLGYLVAVNLGTTWVASRRRWPFLPLAAFLGTVILVAQWWDTTYRPELRGAALAGIGLLWLLFLGQSVLVASHSRFWGTARGVVTLANALLYELVVYETFAPEWSAFRGIAAAVLALVHVAVGAWIARRRGPVPAARSLRTAGIVLGALAVPIQFDLAWITLAWSVMAAALLWSGTESRSLGDRLLAYGIAFLAVIRVLTFDTADSLQKLDSYRPILNGNFLVGAAAAGLTGISAAVLARRRDRLGAERHLIPAFILVAAALLLWRISVETATFFAVRERLSHESTRLPLLLTLSLIWAVYAGLLIAAGFLSRYRPLRLLGVAVIAVLIMKVFFFDAQALEKGYRIASFVGVGFLLLAISILYQKERRT